MPLFSSRPVPPTQHCFCNYIALVSPLWHDPSFFISLSVPDSWSRFWDAPVIQNTLFYCSYCMKKFWKLLICIKLTCSSISIHVYCSGPGGGFIRTSGLVEKQIHHKTQSYLRFTVSSGLYGNCLDYHKLEGKAWKYTYVYIDERERVGCFTSGGNIFHSRKVHVVFMYIRKCFSLSNSVAYFYSLGTHI